MSKPLGRALALLLCLSPAAAQDRPAGDFDYFVLALSWSSSWCAIEGDARKAAQCARGEDRAFVVHGLWPQYFAGWPQFCRTSHRDPSRGQTSAEADLFGSSGSAWHQWKKHGRCTGLSARDYYDLTRAAVDRVEVPDVLENVRKDLAVDPDVIEDAFLEANPKLLANMVTVTCRDGYLAEVRICLGRDLSPVACTGSVARDCRNDRVTLPQIR